MKCFIALLVLIHGVSLWAHPVAFQNSLGIMGQHSGSLSHNQLNYSYRYWWAFGIHHFKRTDVLGGPKATVASTNFLLKRWNGEALQANIYGVLGAGKSDLSGETRDVGMGMLQFDIEDRNYYFLAKHLQLEDGTDTHLGQTTVRAGLAPYVGAFDDLHSWFILEWSEKTFFDENPETDVTPFLRFFYKNVLFEIGQSYNGVTKFNYIIHY